MANLHYLTQASRHAAGGFTDSELALLVAAIAVFGTALTAYAAYLTSKRERRRVLYSEAVRAAVGWKEMLYRVRRRDIGQERALVDSFHKLQDDITYYQAWIGSESEHMKRSYDILVSGMKGVTQELINAAWSDEIRPAPGNAIPSDSHPDVSGLVDEFLSDVRCHLSPWPWRRWQVRRRPSIQIQGQP
jgi:hypothetical protein